MGMSLLHESVDSKKLDVRMVERNTARGVIKADDLDKSLKSLPDDADNAEWISLETLTDEADESENGLDDHPEH
jgi:hypothetical protein